MSCVALDDDLFTPRLIFLGVPTAGENFNVTCRFDGVVERVVVEEASVQFRSPIPGMGVQESYVTRDGPAYIRQVKLNPAMTNDFGKYRCRAIIDVLLGDTFLSPTVAADLQIRS